MKERKGQRKCRPMAVLSSLRKAEAGLARACSPQQQKFPRASKGRPGGGGEGTAQRIPISPTSSVKKQPLNERHTSN